MGPPVVDYERHGRNYARRRRPDPRIAARVHAGLGSARTVVNVGAGAGSYEPDDRWVLAVEPSATMRAQRPATAAPVIAARAESLPLDDQIVDAAMACLTIHHWEPAEAGLAEMRRVARGPVVVLTLDLDAHPKWQLDHLAPGIEIERARFETPAAVAAALGGRTRIERIPTPGDCVDGFIEAFWKRPEACSIPRSEPRSRCGRCSTHRSSTRSSSASPQLSTPGPGTPSTATCASARATTARCAS